MMYMNLESMVPKTRISVPRRRDEIITRPRLLDLLNEFIDKNKKLILVTAPAGYGKTSLLVDYASKARLPVCWYTINSLDCDPYRFISNLIAAIAVKFPNFGQRTLNALQNPGGSPEADTLATIMINDLFDNVSEHFVIILDDFFLVSGDTRIVDFVSRFIQDADENCHLILTSRRTLFFPALMELVSHSAAGGLDREELIFQVEEIQEWFERTQKQVLDEDVARSIFKKTEGWITGIILDTQIGSLSVPAQARLARASGINQDSYFLQLFNQQPEDLRNFLLWTAQLEEFNAERCAQVIEPALSLQGWDWTGLSEQVRNENLFALPVGQDGTWLRYHNLFLRFLQNQARRERPEEVQAIKLSLAQLELENQDWDSAYAIYRDLNLGNKLAELIEKSGPELVTIGRIDTLSNWLDSLSNETAHSHPFILALRGAVATTNGETGLANTLFTQAMQGMHLAQDRQNLARSLVWRAGLYRIIGSHEEAVNDARGALELIENDLEMRKMKAEALRCIGLCHNMQGRSTEALDWLTQALNTSLSIQDRENTAIIQLGLGLVHDNLGNYTQSREMYLEAISHWQQTENAIWLANALNNLGVIQHNTGDYKGAVASYEQGLFYARANKNTRLVAYILTGIGDVYGELSALPEAEDAYQQALEIANQISEDFLQVYILVQQAALAGYQRDFHVAYRRIEEARAIARRDNSAMEINLCELEAAGIKLRQGKGGEAIGPLKQAGAYFATEGHKVQREKANLYLVLAYGMAGNHTRLVETLLKVLACLNEPNPPSALVATAARFNGQLEPLYGLDYLDSQLEGLHNRIEVFKKQLPALRQFFRQNAKAVPFGPPMLIIRALGRAQIKINAEVISKAAWQSLAARDLVFFLLAHPEGMSKDEIGEIFWPNLPPDELKYRIKNTLYRLRHATGKDVILLEQDAYCFNHNQDYEYDVEEFLKKHAQALQAADSDQKITIFREALDLYKGDYLADVDGAWVHPIRETLQRIYLGILLHLAELYQGRADYDQALEFCWQALGCDKYLEEAYRVSFRVFAAMGNRPALKRQYERCWEALMEMDTEPSPQTVSLFEALMG